MKVPADVSASLLWSQAEQGTTEGQDWLLGPERILGHLQPIRPMRGQLAEAGGGAFLLFLQPSEAVLQLAEHVQPVKTQVTIYCSKKYIKLTPTTHRHTQT